MTKPLQLFSIIFENEHIIATNKASGIAVSADRWDDSAQRLDNLVAEALPGGSKIFRVHRIDKDTSGLVLFAKNPRFHRLFSMAFEKNQIQKRYIACVHGRPPWKETECNLPLVPDGNKKHMTIVDKYQGKASLTRFVLVLSAGNYSILEAIPETGRTHQIRVHAAALGFPIVCDSMYGSTKPVLLSSFKRNWRGDPFDEKPLLARLGLHAAEIVIPGGIFSKMENSDSSALDGLHLHAPLPRDMAALIKQMEKHGSIQQPLHYKL